MPSQNMPVQRQMGAILPPDLPCCGPTTRLGEILATGKSHKIKPDGSFPKDDEEMEKGRRNQGITLKTLLDL
jgi:hypothetical protein